MERVERMFPDLAEFLVPLGTLYLDKGDTAKAIGLFQRIVARNPRNPEAHYYLGATLVYQRRMDEAVREFETAMQLDPDYPQPFFGAYYALWESGQRERAVSYLERWANAHPDDAQARDLLDAQRRALGTGENRPALPPPPKPNLP